MTKHFTEPNPRQNFSELEADILKWWKEENILEKSIEQRPKENTFTFYDGPITANGAPHMGHTLTFAVKDLVPRYWTMKGYRVSRSLGWDCHGIPVEYEVEKNLGFTQKKDIEEYGVEKFNKKCRASVEKHKDAIIELEELVGRITNDEEEYATMDSWYIESVWWSLKELYEKGTLYEGFKVVPYSTRAGTTLSNAEVALGGYKPIVDPAITVEFPLVEDENTRILAWTTTPWTMPGNLGLAVGKDIVYAKVQVEGSDKSYIVAKELVESVFDGKDFTVTGTLSSSELVGKEYIPPFDFFKGHANAHKIYEGFHVTTESGTGIVHLAPYGAEDNEIFQQVGIESFDYLNEQGDFTDMIPPYAGQFYKKANKNIVADLTEKDVLFKHEDYEHDMPMCWRTDTPLIYKPITSWYVAMSKFRDRLVELNNTINWEPEHVKQGRFGNWLENVKDWGISRTRYWGTPLPIWKSESGKVKVIGSFEELEKLSGQKIDDPHRPYIDDVTFELDGEKYSRIPDVLDVWYDSGSMPFARLHYPFENKEKFERKFPAQFIAEGVDQTRGWFYSLHAIATTVFDNVAFENVTMNGFTLDDKGVKQSKSKKNYEDPVQTLKNFGADAVRLNFFSTPIVAGEDTTVTPKTIKLQVQETILPLWNIYKYFVTYANMHDWTPEEKLAYNKRNVTDDAHPWDHIPFNDIENQLDAWMLALLQETIHDVNKWMGEYKIPKATNKLKETIAELSKWYIRSNRDRFADGDEMAISVLYYSLVELMKLLAPFAPFISEHIYRELAVKHNANTPESIHLCDYPEADANFMREYENVLSEMEVVRKMVELGHTIRTEGGIKVRQPLNALYVELRNEDVPVLADWMKDLLQNELNVKTAAERANIDNHNTLTDSKLGITIMLDTEITEELKMEGTLREIVRNVQSGRKKMQLDMNDIVSLSFNVSDESIRTTIEKFTEELQQSVSANKIGFTEEKSDDMVSFKVDGQEVFVKIEKI